MRTIFSVNLHYFAVWWPLFCLNLRHFPLSGAQKASIVFLKHLRYNARGSVMQHCLKKSLWTEHFTNISLWPTLQPENITYRNFCFLNWFPKDLHFSYIPIIFWSSFPRIAWHVLWVSFVIPRITWRICLGMTFLVNLTSVTRNNAFWIIFAMLPSWSVNFGPSGTTDTDAREQTKNT